MPATITVTLLGAAKKAQFSREGIYILQPDDVNGKKHWIKQGGSNALWYGKKGYWNIGPLWNCGSDTAGLISNVSIGPLEATTWKYVTYDQCIGDDHVWIEATDLIILSAGI